jgi:uncharacterized protein YjbI with pentapeptide repeats
MADETTREDTLGATSKATPDTATAFAAKARDLAAMREAVVDAAAVSAGLWLSYLFLLFYLAIAVGSITHRDLFLENPVRLPFLGVELPLVAFFGLAPALFLVVHAYVLLHFVQFADKLGVFRTEFRAQITDPVVRARLRRQLPSNIFVQLLAGPREIRAGVMGSMLWLIAHISLVLAPVALLVLFLLKFLPYHDGLTWWHRVAVLADIALLWALWPSVARGKVTRIVWKEIRVARFAPAAFVRLLGTLPSAIARRQTRRNAWRVFRRAKVAALALASLLLASLVFTIATYPGEWLHENWPAARFIPTKWPPTSVNWASPHEVLFASDPNEASTSFAPRSTSLLSNHLILPNLAVIDYARFDSEAKILALSQSISLRGRHFERAVLSGANLRNANLRDAHLQGALLGNAELQGANFEGADLRDAKLDSAQLQGASLIKARLQGASLALAKLQGANLSGAQLQGAYLDSAQLQGATLDGATLWGAVLNDAVLEGALLDGAQLQGASLRRARLQGASLKSVFVWMADYPGDAAMRDTLVTELETEEKYKCDSEPCAWPPKNLVRLKQPSDDQEQQEKQEKEQQMQLWEKLKKSESQTDVSAYAKRLVIRLTATGCESKGAPYVIRQLAVRMQDPFKWDDAASPSELAKAFLDETNCFGARSLSEKDKAELRDIKNRASSPPL